MLNRKKAIQVLNSIEQVLKHDKDIFKVVRRSAVFLEVKGYDFLCNGYFEYIENQGIFTNNTMYKQMVNYWENKIYG